MLRARSLKCARHWPTDPTHRGFGPPTPHMTTDAPKPMTNAERQRAFRARKAAQTAAEVRGVFAHPDDHRAVKDYAAKLAKKRAKAEKADGA